MAEVGYLTLLNTHFVPKQYHSFLVTDTKPKKKKMKKKITSESCFIFFIFKFEEMTRVCFQ